jgi:hypothetical protein
MWQAMFRLGRVLGLVGPLVAAAVNSATAHDWYSRLKDANGLTCCNNRDCRPVAYCACADGGQCIEFDRQCVPIPWDRVLPLASPDGQPHACWWPSTPYLGTTEPMIFCVILPGVS